MTRNGSLAALAAVLFLAPVSFGQVVSGDIVGLVTDSSGAAVPNTVIQAVNTATGIRKTAQTDDNGQYRLNNLLAGSYEITASAQGFTPVSVKNVAVDVNKTVTANVTMQIGKIATSLEVTESTAVIDTTTAVIQNTFEARQAQDLPVASFGLGVLNLAMLTSGVTSNGGIGAGTGPSVGGQRPYNNNFMVEGVDNNDKSVTGPLIFVPNDAVAEFNVLQNQVGAEFGHSSGGQFNTTLKSGTNNLHGAVYDYLQNRDFDAVDQVLGRQGITKNPRYDQNRLGADIGGPILKNKLFYFGDFEYNPLGEATSPSASVLTPTAAGFSTLAAIPGLNANNLSILKQYVPAAPAATTTTMVEGVAVPVGILPLASPNFANAYYGVASVDYNISDHDQLRGRYLYNKASFIDIQSTLPVFYQTIPNTYNLLALTEYHNFSPGLTNEFRAGYNRYNNSTPAGDFKFSGLDVFPSLQVNDLNLQIGPDPNAPQTTIQNTYQLTDNLTWVRGKHTLTTGVEGRKYIAPQTFTQRGRGDYEYTTLEVYLRDLTPDSLAQRSVGSPVYYGDQIAIYAFGNDSWRVRPNLTFNLGVRYEFTSVPFSERSQTLNAISDVPGVLEFQKPQPQYKNFAPRIGVAWSPGKGGKTSIRAGFGMSYDVIYDNIGILDLPPQLSTTVDVTNNSGNPLAGAPNFLASGGIPPNASTGVLSADDARAQTAAYIPNQKLPYAIQWNFGIQHVFANNYTFEARYLGTRGVHLDVQQRFTKVAPVQPGNSLPTFLTAPTQAQLDALPLTLTQLQNEPTILPQFSQFSNPVLVENSPIGNSSYQGLALQLQRRFSNGLQFMSSYTWSHLIDDSTADFFSTVVTPRRPQDGQDMRNDRSSSALDRRHRVTVTAIYDVPWFRKSNWFLKNTVGNWSVAPIYIYESPEYATVQSQVDSNLNEDHWGDRAVLNPAGRDGTGSGVTPLTNTSGDVVGYLAQNPNARYILAGPGVFPNAGRNTLPLRPINNFDLNLLKNFTFRERFKLQASAQFLNFLNHPQYVPGLPDQAANPVVLNTGAAILNALTPGDPTFNRPDLVFPSNARLVQFALKLMF